MLLRAAWDSVYLLCEYLNVYLCMLRCEYFMLISSSPLVLVVVLLRMLSMLC